MLDAYQWPECMTREFYLQGSYRNDTNIRGDSDVDVVLEMTSSFDHDASALAEYDQRMLESTLQPATYGWDDFRRETLKALQAGFGDKQVGQGNKSIKLKADPLRLAADVVVGMTYRRYNGYQSYVEGITFWALSDKDWIVNYPKEHYTNGAGKSARTWDRYKRTVRMFKNARNRLQSTGRIRSDLAPSYFVECLLFNAPDWSYQTSYQETYRSIVNWMAQSRFDELVCQNGQQRLFGPSSDQWSIRDAKALADQLARLWNDWE